MRSFSKLDSMAALLLSVFGFACICVEFCRPGLVVPGVAGATLVALNWRGAIAAAINRPGSALGILIPAALAAVFLLAVAFRARRNKLDSKLQ